MTVVTLRAALDQLADSANTAVFGVPPDELGFDFRELLRRTVAMAAGLRRQGVRPGDRVVMRIGSSPQDVTMLLAVIYLCAVPVSVKPTVPGMDDAAYLAEVAKEQWATYAYGIDHPNLVMLRPSQVDDASIVQSAVVDRDSVAFIQYTSGSTGSPRPVPLTHRALLADIDGIGAIPRVRHHRTGFIVVPLHHDMGLVGMLSCLVNHLDLYLVETSAFLRRPVRCLELAADLGVTETAMPDFLLRFLSSRLRNRAGGRAGLLRSWDTIYCGAEPIRQQTTQGFLTVAGEFELDPTALVFCYGLAEASLLVSAHRYVDDTRSFDHAAPARAACLGRPIRGVEIDIRNEDGSLAAEGALGAVRLRGSVMFNGYDGRTDHQVAWFDTGDLGYRRNGDLYLSGRRTDRIVVNGGNMFVSDVESHLLRRADVADCVVLPHGESFSVLVVPAAPASFDPASLADAVVSAFAVAPVSVRRVGRQDIVRTASGKPIRGDMVEKLLKGTSR